MKPSLQTRLGQQLTLTPQLRQAIRLLQLSSIELEQEINAAVEANPFLEHEGDSFEASPEANGSEAAPAENDTGPDASPETAAEHIDDHYNDDGDYEWSGATRQHDGEDDDFPQDNTAVPQDLHGHLDWQLQLSHLSERDRLIGQTLIEAINDDGYLVTTLEEIRATLAPDLIADEEEIEAVLHLIQRFDPVGVGARNLSECLGVQLGLLSADTPGLEEARLLCRQHLDALARLGADRLATQLGWNGETMETGVALLKSLDPRPGASISTGPTEYIAPDAIAYRQGGVWKVAAAPGSQPRLAINRHYQHLIGKASRDADNYLRGQLQEARWLMKSLESRADTLLRVARSIVRQQSGFLEHGEQAMRPLTLREVAEELGLHESTVSRATTRKFLRTPRGTFEFKYFFSSGIATDDGGGASATAIQAMLKRMIDDENPRSPLSDARLADRLKADGIPVARRTVAKYREAMNIPSSHERQRL